MLHWWRPAIFLMFLFGAIVTPTPDPFAMSILAGCLTLLYFAAIGFASINDRRRGRRRGMFGNIDDDATSAIDFDETEPIVAGEPVSISSPIATSERVTASGSTARPQPIDERYDDAT
jgi:sec-independent protein translocase protein TatC